MKLLKIPIFIAGWPWSRDNGGLPLQDEPFIQVIFIPSKISELF